MEVYPTHLHLVNLEFQNALPVTLLNQSDEQLSRDVNPNHQKQILEFVPSDVDFVLAIQPFLPYQNDDQIHVNELVSLYHGSW